MKLSRTSISVDGYSRGVELFYLNEQLPPGAAVYLLYRQEDLKRKTFSMPFDPIYIGQTEDMAELCYEDVPQDKLSEADMIAVLWKWDDEILDELFCKVKKSFPDVD